MLRRCLIYCTVLLVGASTSGQGQSVRRADSVAVADTLMRYTQCFGAVLGVFPRWSATHEVINDPAEKWLGRTMAWFAALQARVQFNFATLRISTSSLREIALHEVLHLTIGELAGVAAMESRDLAGVLNEQTVRIMARWPVWKGVCEL